LHGIGLFLSSIFLHFNNESPLLVNLMVLIICLAFLFFQKSNKLDLKGGSGELCGHVQFDLIMSQSCEAVQARLLNIVANTNLEGVANAVYSLNYQCTLRLALLNTIHPDLLCLLHLLSVSRHSRFLSDPSACCVLFHATSLHSSVLPSFPPPFLDCSARVAR
jgi:hypothetical protein